MTPHNDFDSPPSVSTVRQDLHRQEWEMAQKLFALASHLLMRLRLDPTCPSPAQIGALLELASRLGRLATDAPAPAAPAQSDRGGTLPPAIQAALARFYGASPHSASSPGILESASENPAPLSTLNTLPAVASAKVDQPSQ